MRGPLPPAPVLLAPSSLDRVIPVLIDGLVLLHRDLDVPDAPLSPEVGDEEHVPDDVDRPWVSWPWLSRQDRCEESREACAFIRGSCSQCYLTGA